MNEDKFIQLIHKNLTETLSDAEKDMLERYTSTNTTNAVLREEIELTWKLTKVNFKIPEFDVEEQLQKFKQNAKQIDNTIFKKESQILNISEPDKTSYKKIIPLWQKFSAVAAVLIVTFGAWYIFSQSGQFDKPITKKPIEVIPEDSLIVNEATIKLIETTEEKETFVLPDSSKVTLNKNSSIAFEQNFIGEKRIVELKSNEAYFEVKYNKHKPFKVKTPQNVLITVIGTKFNVKETEKETTVFVTEGEVKVEVDDQLETLTSSESVNYAHKKHILKKETNISNNVISWKTKRISFDDHPLSQAVNELENIYNVDIEISDTNMVNCSLTLLTKHRENVEDVLNSICKIHKLTLHKTDEKFILYGGKCN